MFDRNEKIIGEAAEFHKDSRGKLRLFNLWTLTSGVFPHDGKPYIGSDGYDVEWSRTWGCYIFHNSSSGFRCPEVSGVYFKSGEMKIKEKPCQLVDGRDKPPWKSKRTRAIRERNRTRCLARLPKAISIEHGGTILDWLQEYGMEYDTVYCSVCKDFLPTNEDNACDHCWWCTKSATWSTPDERCKCKDYVECQDREY